jgi:hypothetical protein
MGKQLLEEYTKWLIEHPMIGKFVDSGEISAELVDEFVKERGGGKADSTSEKDLRVCEVINSVSSAPQWFTEDKRKLALQIWNQHETGDNKRVQVVKLIKEWAADEEYIISFKKAYELFQQHCL